jgi:small subunit ribosomal protein S14
MARKALIEKSKLTPKFSTRKRNRCLLSGRPRGFLRKFGLGRLFFRKLALEGMLPGVNKASW